MMNKILITGYSGFVSRYFINYLDENKIKSEILGIDLIDSEYKYCHSEHLNTKFEKVDLLDSIKLKDIILSFHPDYIVHLASYSSVGLSWKNPSLSFRNNMDIFLNLLEIIRETAPKCRILSVGSSEEYGNVKEDKIPLKEESCLNPVSPYAVARVSQEQLSKVYCDGYGLNIVMTRSFNHIGAGQKDIFAISSFAKQLVEIKKTIKREQKLITGDITVVRDFLDVRDVVNAYYRLLINGKKGEVYNVCSGTGVSLEGVIRTMCQILDIQVEIEIDSGRIRPNDNRVIIGSNEKLKQAIEWEPKVSLKESLRDIIDYWYKKVE